MTSPLKTLRNKALSFAQEPESFLITPALDRSMSGAAVHASYVSEWTIVRSSLSPAPSVLLGVSAYRALTQSLLTF